MNTRYLFFEKGYVYIERNVSCTEKKRGEEQVKGCGQLLEL